MNIIKEYARSKGVEKLAQSNFDNVMLCLMDEYGYLAPVVKNKTQAKVVTVAINVDDFNLHTRYLESVEPREPKEPEIIGILVIHKNNTYRLIDGYHRFKWAMENRTEANFILLT